jgi:TonB family protein
MMAPLTNDSVELANPAGETAVSQSASQPKSAPGLRSDALSLEVPVKVHGSRVVEVARGTAPQTEPFEEQTVTMIVFPQGAVVRMASPVSVSQMLVLTNLKTKQDSICRVLKVRPNANLGSYVEVEFTHRQQGYWGVSFSSDGPAATSAIAPPKIDLESQPRPPYAPPPSTISPVAPAMKQPAATTVTRDAKPAASTPPSTPFVPTLKPESSFISIGSQERVQEAASATSTTTKPLSPVERRLENPAPPILKLVPAIETLAPAPPAPSITELQGDEDAGSSSTVVTEIESSAVATAPLSGHDEEQQSSHEEVSASATSRPAREIFGNFGGTAVTASQPAQAEAFGARLDSGLGTSATRDSGANQNWILIAACIAVLVIALGAGIFYFRQHASNTNVTAARASTNAPQSASGNSGQLPAITPPGQPYMAGGAEANQPLRSSTAAAPSVPAPASANLANEAKLPAGNSTHPVPAPKQAAPSVTSDMMSSALSTHPTTSNRGDEGQSDQAPALDPSAAAPGNNALPGISSPNAASLPAPEMRPEGPVKIGGDVKEPKLLTSVTPQYPPAARSSGTQGDVVVETTIDKTGNVVRMHTISGPSILRPAALDALRRWKYEPSRLDGEPVEVQMQVTIKFRL